MSAVAEKTVETVVENVDDAIDGTVEVIEAVRSGTNFKVVGGVLLIAGLGIGAAGGYFFAKKRLESLYEERITEEMADAREFYAGVYKTDEDGEPLTPQQVMARRHPDSVKAAQAVREYQGLDGEPEGTPHDDIMDEELLAKTVSKVSVARTDHGAAAIVEETKRVNVFKDDTFDLEEEVKFRSDEKPYIITHEEFLENDGDLTELSLTYFKVDDVLVGEDSKPIENTDAMVGDDHLVRFGAGSGDPKVVYVRNEARECIYEIVKSKGSYLEEVLGIPNDEPDSLSHSNRDARLNRRREFRRGLD